MQANNVEVNRFCRICGAGLDEAAKFCRLCGQPVVQSAVSLQPISQPILEPVRRASTIQLSPRLRPILGVIVPLAVLVVFASYLLGQYVASTEVRTYFLDDYFYSRILGELRSNPTAYYSITDTLYRQLYSGTHILYHFPLTFYLWLLIPNLADLKWLYFGFALTGVVASYFAAYTVTKQGLVAFFPALWIAYFLETPVYLMLDYWPIPVFLIGLAFFLMRRPVPAVIAIGVATLLKEVFAPFLIFASLYYLLAARQEWWPWLVGGRLGRQIRSLTGTRNLKKARVWVVGTAVVGLMYIINDIASFGGFSPLSHSLIQNVQGFDLGALWLLFSNGYFTSPPVFSVVLAVALALIGIAFLERDQRVILIASFAVLPLLIAMGVVSTIYAIPTATNLPSRWVALSIALMNFFWLLGPYAVAKQVYRWARHGFR